MNALLVALFFLGLGLGVVVRILRPPEPRRRRPRPNNRLDTVDEMILWGEVNHDDFYGM